MSDTKIIWTKIDEAPALATYSLLPIVNAFTNAAGVEVEIKDIYIGCTHYIYFSRNAIR